MVIAFIKLSQHTIGSVTITWVIFCNCVIIGRDIGWKCTCNSFGQKNCVFTNFTQAFVLWYTFVAYALLMFIEESMEHHERQLVVKNLCVRFFCIWHVENVNYIYYRSQQIPLLLISLFSINLPDVNIILFAWIYHRKVGVIQCLSQLLLLFLSVIFFVASLLCSLGFLADTF